MAVFGIGLNPLSDVAKIGHGIGSLFGNGDDLLYSGGVLGGGPAPQVTGGTFPAPTQTIQSAPKSQDNLGAAAPSGGISDPQSLAQYNQAMSVLQGGLNRLPSQLGIAQGNIQGQYNTNLNELNSGQQQAQGQYNQSTGQNSQNYVQNKNQITDQASSGLHSLQRLLGLHGAGGSSDALYSAPQAVATQASQQRAGAGQTYGQNQQGLDTSWNNYQTGFNQSKQKLSDWLSQNLNSAQAQSDTARQGLLTSLAGLQASPSAAQPYIDQAQGLNSQIDQLGALNPTYNGVAPTYSAPSVASYTVNPNAPIQQSNSALESTTSPFLSLLLGNQKNKNQLQQPAF